MEQLLHDLNLKAYTKTFIDDKITPDIFCKLSPHEYGSFRCFKQSRHDEITDSVSSTELTRPKGSSLNIRRHFFINKCFSNVLKNRKFYRIIIKKSCHKEK